jgi:cytoskeletal protein CcmA (bactofilin family)
LETVNGSITLDDGVKVANNVTTVNGKLILDKGADVGGRLENVNGTIRLTEAHVGKGIHTTSGDIEIGANSKVEGGIKVEREGMGFHFGKNSIPRIVIGPGAVVEGPLTFERKVNLYVSDSAKIGPVTGAEAVKFSGENPPG